ncbi:MAG: YicC family protein [Clostridia bacterium]|nr:YicC family protein [Clostridia bacterium]
MANSMTGFGRSRKTVDGLDITAEIKSVNSRFFDCSTKISRAYGYLEERVKPFLQSLGVVRGKVDVYLSVESSGSTSNKVRLDRDYLESYLEALDVLHEDYRLKDDRSVMKVASLPGLFLSEKPNEDVEEDWRRVSEVLKEAAEKFFAARKAEGASLAADLLKKLDGIEAVVGQIEELSKDDIEHYRERLAERVRNALADNQITIDESRILTECAIHADKVAVDEELVRLRTHIASFRKILATEDAVGRKLDFLMQEMNREINTTGSKCSDAAIAALVVDVKCELEKMREQIQNLE